LLLVVAAATTFSPIYMDAQSSSTNDNASQLVSNSSQSFTHSFHPQTSFSLGTFGQFTPTRIDSRSVPDVYGVNGVPQMYFSTSGASPTAGVLGTFRQQFRPWLGYSVNMAYTRLTERFTEHSNITDPYSNTDYDVKVNSDMYELSLSYIAGKQLTPHMSGFAEAGAGVLAFLPVVPASVVSTPNNSFENQLYFANVAFAPETVAGGGALAPCELVRDPGRVSRAHLHQHGFPTYIAQSDDAQQRTHRLAHLQLRPQVIRSNRDCRPTICSGFAR
jgi:hypothetical protein